MKKFLSLFLAVVLTTGTFLAAPIQLPGLVVFANAEETTVPEGNTGTPEDTTAPGEGEPGEEETDEETPAPEYELKFTLINNNSEYTVTGYTGTPVDVIIPAEYEGKPVTTIANSAFHFCRTIKSVTIPKSIKTIDRDAFLGTTLEQVKIEGNGLTYIGYSAFYNCTALKSINLPNTLNTIDDYAFNSCTSLEKITFPNSLTTIGTRAFAGCTTLQEVTIPGNVKSVMEYAFGGCSGIKSLTLLDGAQCDSSAFEGCVNLEKIDLPNTHVNFAAANFKGSKIYKDKNNWYGDSFYIDNQLINTTWYKHGARTVRAGTTHLNPGAFAGTKNLIAVTIPASVKYIGNDAFNNSSISIIYYEGTESQFKQIDIGNNGERLAKMAIICQPNKNQAPKKVQVKSTVNVAGGVQITWNKVANAELYAIYRRGADSNIWNLLGVSTETSVIDTSAGHREYWRYSVQAINDNGVSPFDNNGKYLKYVRTPKLTGLYNVKDGIELTWQEVDGASGYRVYRRAAGQSWKYLGTVKGTAYLDKAVKNNNGKYYRYTVRAVVDGRYSGYEDYLYTMRLTAPKLVSAKHNDNFQLVIKWKAAPAATGYSIYGYNVYHNYWEYIGRVSGGKKTSYTIKGGIATESRYNKYTVVATNGKYSSELNTTGI